VVERWEGDDPSSLDFFINLTPSFLQEDLPPFLRELCEHLLEWECPTVLEFDQPANGWSFPGIFCRVSRFLWVGCFLGRDPQVWRTNVKSGRTFLIFENNNPEPVAKEIFTMKPPAWVRKLQPPGSTLHHYKIPLVPGGKRKAYFSMPPRG
jgi:hypothetical protein